MFGSVVLDVAIGVAFVYLLMSLIASVVQEIISTYLQLRPANLLRGIRSLFSGDSLFGKDLVDALYNHGLVRGLYSDPTYDNTRKIADPPPNAAAAQKDAQSVLDKLNNAKQQENRAYQAAKAAAAQPGGEDASKKALIELANATMEVKMLAHKHSLKLPLAQAWAFVQAQEGVLRQALRWLIRVPEVAPPGGVAISALLPSYIPTRTFGTAMVDILNGNNAAGDDVMKAITQALRDHHWLYQENRAGQALYALALHAKGDIRAFQTSLENWYNDSMDRASGWYKRYTQRILLAIGLVLAVCFNVDSVRVAQTLWFDRDARSAMVDAASQYQKTHSSAASTPDTGGQGGAYSAEDLKDKLTGAADAFTKATSDALLPVGWKTPPADRLVQAWNLLFPGQDVKTHMPILRDWKLIRSTAWRCAALLLGWLITGMAISLGAPFWFDTLNKFMVVRSTVKPQEKSRTEASKD